MLGLLFKHSRTIIGWGIVVAALSVAVSLVFPWQYSAVSRVIIISRDKTGVDPYTQAKAAERVGQDLAQIMKTTDFYTKVVAENAAVFDTAVWKNLDDRAQRKKWQKDVQAQMVYGASLLEVTAYALGQDNALALSNAVTKTLVAHGWEYSGGDVAIKQVDSALVSRLPARPNIIVNAAIGLLVGGFLAALWIVRYKR
jgi:capsular polysaccharide biosynthesis protein